MLHIPVGKRDGDSQGEALWHSHHDDGDPKNEEVQDLVRFLLVEAMVLDKPPATVQQHLSADAGSLLQSC